MRNTTQLTLPTMSLLSPLSRLTFRASAPCRTCLRSFTSSAPMSDAPNAPNPITMFGLDQRSTPQRRPLQPIARSPPSSPADSAANNEGLLKAFETQISEQDKASKKRASDPAIRQEVERLQEGPLYERQMTRRWKEGDVYAPHDISGVEMSKWKQMQKKGRPKKDVFDMLKINPMDHYKNFAMMSEFMTEMGKIRHSSDTGLRPVNQRKIARAVRRAIGLGLMPSVHKHPELLRKTQRGM